MSTAEFSEPLIKYACTYCQEKISVLRIKCAECVEFIICLEDDGLLIRMDNSGWTAKEKLEAYCKAYKSTVMKIGN